MVSQVTAGAPRVVVIKFWTPNHAWTPSNPLMETLLGIRLLLPCQLQLYEFIIQYGAKITFHFKKINNILEVKIQKSGEY